MGIERRGFASISKKRRSEIASLGGRKAHAIGTAHTWTSEEAREAGRKGGKASRGGKGKLPEGSADIVAAPADLLLDPDHHDDISRFADEGCPHV